MRAGTTSTGISSPWKAHVLPHLPAPALPLSCPCPVQTLPMPCPCPVQAHAHALPQPCQSHNSLPLAHCPYIGLCLGARHCSWRARRRSATTSRRSSRRCCTRAPTRPTTSSGWNRSCWTRCSSTSACATRSSRCTASSSMRGYATYMHTRAYRPRGDLDPHACLLRSSVSGTGKRSVCGQRGGGRAIAGPGAHGGARIGLARPADGPAVRVAASHHRPCVLPGERQQRTRDPRRLS